MLMPFVITALAALPIIPAAWLVHHKLTHPDQGRHRIALIEKPYRPHPPARPPMPPVVPGHGPLTEAEARARMVPMPVAPPAWRSDATESLPTPLGPEDRTFLEAVAAQPKVDGPDPFAVSPPATPDDWFGVPKDNTRKLERTQ